MSKYYCLDIEFPGVDFDPYFITGKKEVDKIHHVHLYIKTNEIELRIFYDAESYFGDKLDVWSDTIDYKKFRSFIRLRTTKNHTNERIQKIDISDAKLCEISNSSNYYEDGNKYVIVKIDTVKFYCNPNEENKNTA